MSTKTSASLAVILVIFLLVDDVKAGAEDVVWMTRNVDNKAKRFTSTNEELKIFCFEGQHPSLADFWSSAALKIMFDDVDDEFNAFLGPNTTSVMQADTDHEGHWLPTTAPGFQTPRQKGLTTVRLNPFEESSCIGIRPKMVSSSATYTVVLQVYRINYWLVCTTLVGVLLFVYAPLLCRNVFFHYSTGVFVGVAFSFLVLVYLVQRKMHSSFLGGILAGYSLALYFMTSLWANLQDYIVEHHVYVVGYVLAAGGISFAACYRLGPVQNERTLNLIQWCLQLAALVLIYVSSYYQAASFTLAAIVLTWSAIPDRTKSRMRSWYQKG